ncbi:hypothetical protein [Ciceribacter sp. L1K22]|uniref:hypothetical protein n=1 Tax=Ciceribacter sp. L1K22 TaxID=2820275 RepID=UPI001ABDFBAE|nr:hypothetical protein [Ciceribacter sp. L1K22]MBO3760401.1 hypothetical protein [Ciceribacter sp. L1K22]
MSELLRLWFFRDLTHDQRLKLFGLFDLPVHEIGPHHGRQARALRHIGQSLVKMVAEEGSNGLSEQPRPVGWWYEDQTGCLHISLDLELGNKHARENGWEINWLTSCEPSRFFETLVIGRPTPAQIEKIRNAFYRNSDDDGDDPWVKAFEAVQLRLGVPDTTRDLCHDRNQWSLG